MESKRPALKERMFYQNRECYVVAEKGDDVIIEVFADEYEGYSPAQPLKIAVKASELFFDRLGMTEESLKEFDECQIKLSEIRQKIRKATTELSVCKKSAALEMKKHAERCKVANVKELLDFFNPDKEKWFVTTCYSGWNIVWFEDIKDKISFAPAERKCTSTCTEDGACEYCDKNCEAKVRMEKELSIKIYYNGYSLKTFLSKEDAIEYVRKEISKRGRQIQTGDIKFCREHNLDIPSVRKKEEENKEANIKSYFKKMIKANKDSEKYADLIKGLEINDERRTKRDPSG